MESAGGFYFPDGIKKLKWYIKVDVRIIYYINQLQVASGDEAKLML